MPRKAAKKKRKPGMLKGLRFNEVSFVGKGANQAANISIIKMDGDETQVAKEMFNDILGRMITDKELYDFVDDLYMTNSALSQSIRGIVHDYNNEYPDKKQAILNNLQQFVQAFTSMVTDTDVIKSLDAVDALIGKTETQTEVEKMAERDLAFYKAMDEMNDEERTFFKSLPEDKQEEMAKAMTPEAMEEMRQMMADKKKKGAKTKVKAKKADDESFEMDGNTINKSDVGDAAFLLMKGLVARIEKSEGETADANKIAKEEKELRIEKEMADEAEARWPNLPGEPIGKGKLLRGILKMDEGSQKTQLAMLDAGNSSSADLYVEKGHGKTPDGSNASQKLVSLAKELSEKTGDSEAVSYSAVLETEVGKKLYEDTLG